MVEVIRLPFFRQIIVISTVILCPACDKGSTGAMEPFPQRFQMKTGKVGILSIKETNRFTGNGDETPGTRPPAEETENLTTELL